jgi:hypothetical protein
VKALIDVLFPLTHPTPFLAVVGECFAWSAAGAVVVLIVIRFGWRRGKGLEDL